MYFTFIQNHFPYSQGVTVGKMIKTTKYSKVATDLHSQWQNLFLDLDWDMFSWDFFQDAMREATGSTPDDSVVDLSGDVNASCEVSDGDSTRALYLSNDAVTLDNSATQPQAFVSSQHQHDHGDTFCNPTSDGNLLNTDTSDVPQKRTLHRSKDEVHEQSRDTQCESETYNDDLVPEHLHTLIDSSFITKTVSSAASMNVLDNRFQDLVDELKSLGASSDSTLLRGIVESHLKDHDCNSAMMDVTFFPHKIISTFFISQYDDLLDEAREEATRFQSLVDMLTDCRESEAASLMKDVEPSNQTWWTGFVGKCAGHMTDAMLGLMFDMVFIAESVI